jgi:transposase
MARELVPDVLWEELKDLIPTHPPHPKGGADWADDRRCLRGIVFVLRTGLQWNELPAEAFGVSGVTCWRRLRDWTRAGVWPAMHARVLRDLESAGGVDHSLGVVDSASVRAVKGGRTPARTRRTGPRPGASDT